MHQRLEVVLPCKDISLLIHKVAVLCRLLNFLELFAKGVYFRSRELTNQP
jgi:hypothetical protein